MQRTEEYRVNYQTIKERANPTLFFRLVWSEYLRVGKYLLGFIALLIFFQVAAFSLRAFTWTGRETLTDEHLLGHIHAVTEGWLFNIPIMVSAGGLLFYSVLTWYQEWFGKHTFIYRLLMLPIDRLAIFLAKLSAIFMAIATLILAQFLLLHLGQTILVAGIYGWQLPPLPLSSLIEATLSMELIFPLDLRLFIMHYGLGLLLLVVLFTAIIIERSFPYIGFFLGAAYAGLHFYGFILTSFGIGLWYNFWEDSHPIFNLFNGSILLIISLSLILSHYLMNHKLRV